MLNIRHRKLNTLIIMSKELFDDIKKIKQGRKKDISNPLLSVAQKIIQSKPLEPEINQAHKQSLKAKLEAQLKPEISVISVLKTMFSLQPKNLVAYGSLITVVALAVLLTTTMPGPVPMKDGLVPMKEGVFEAVRMEQAPVAPAMETQKEEMPADFEVALVIIAGFGMLLLVVGVVRFYKLQRYNKYKGRKS